MTVGAGRTSSAPIFTCSAMPALQRRILDISAKYTHAVFQSNFHSTQIISQLTCLPQTGGYTCKAA